MKKIIIISCLFLLVACQSNTADIGLKEISGEDIVLKTANKETFFVMISNDDCYSCEVFQKEVEPILEDQQVLLYELNVNELEESIVDQVEIALGSYSSWPALFYVQEGEIAPTNKYEYSLDPEGWMIWMQNMGFIK